MQNSIHRKNRNRIRIIADILEITKNGSRKTRIMYRGNLSYDLMKKYLQQLTKFGLLEVEGKGEKVYRTTEKGRKFLDEFENFEARSRVVSDTKQLLERYLTTA